MPAGHTGTGTYLVTWNGHGDAMALHRIESSGSLTLANSYTYGTWGRPTTATHNSIADLGFRFLYEGAADVQWDSTHGLDLLYMHARHYSPSLGRFLQPDASRTDAQLFVYAENGPVSRVDPAGMATFNVWWARLRVFDTELRKTLIYGFTFFSRPTEFLSVTLNLGLQRLGNFGWGWVQGPKEYTGWGWETVAFVRGHVYGAKCGWEYRVISRYLRSVPPARAGEKPGYGFGYLVDKVT